MPREEDQEIEVARMSQHVELTEQTVGLLFQIHRAALVCVSGRAIGMITDQAGSTATIHAASGRPPSPTVGNGDSANTDDTVDEGCGPTVRRR